MPDKKDDKPDSLDRVRGDRGLTRRSGFMARRVKELVQKARELKLADEIEVIFPDKNLEAAVREELEKPEGPLTRGNLKRLATLRRYSTGIEDLSGLEHAANLIWLALVNSQISDVSPLASLTNLTGLGLLNNQIRDVSPLASLTNLTQLYIRGNQVRDVSPLASLTNLTELWLDGNQISDLSPLASLTNLTWLHLYENSLNQESIDVHVPSLEARGVEVFL